MKKVLSINDSVESLQKEIKESIQELNKENKPILLLCFGSANTGGDNFAPQIGSILVDTMPISKLIIGTMKQPLHRLNAILRLSDIDRNKFFIISIGLGFNDNNSDYILYRTLLISDKQFAVGSGGNGEVMKIGDLCITLTTNDHLLYSPCKGQAIKMSQVFQAIL